MENNLENKLNSEDPSIINVNGNGKKNTWSRKMAAYGAKIRKNGPVQKHLAGALVSKVYGTYGPKAQIKKAKLWGVRDSYFTKLDSTIWWGIALAVEHAPLLAGGAAMESLTNVSYGFDLAALNLVASTTINTYRLGSSFIFNKPFPSVSLLGAPIQLAYYRKNIQSKAKEIKQDLDNEYNFLMSK